MLQVRTLSALGQEEDKGFDILKPISDAASEAATKVVKKGLVGFAAINRSDQAVLCIG